MEDVPFPEILFSATLVQSAASHSLLLSDIVNKLNANTLNKGKIKLSCPALINEMVSNPRASPGPKKPTHKIHPRGKPRGIPLIKNKTSVKINPRKGLEAFKKLLTDRDKIPQQNFFETLNTFLESNFASLTGSSFEPLNSSDISIVKDYLFTTFLGYFAGRKAESAWFDNQLKFTQYTLRDTLEVSDKTDEKYFMKSSAANIEVEI